MRKLVVLLISFVLVINLFVGCTTKQETSLNFDEYLKLADTEFIYPSAAQIEMLKSFVPEASYQPAPSASDREYWEKIAVSAEGLEYFNEAVSLLDKKPEVPISDEIYRRANREGNRGIYKPRYYRTMDRLERFILAECMENEGRFIPQIEVYIDSVMSMKSWLHPNHDDSENSVLEGKYVSIDLGARKFGLVLALADALLEDKLSVELRTEIADQLQWRITDSYLGSCKEDVPENHKASNKWIRTTSNWNSVCNSGTIFTTIVASKNNDERIAAIGSALNSTVYYLSGFGDDGYCSEGTGYWNYGFGHYLYLAEILFDYTNGKINLYEFNNPEKLKKVANFPENFEIQNGLYAPFSDGVTRIKSGNDNFAYLMAAKHYGARKPTYFVPDESVQTIIGWEDAEEFTDKNGTKTKAPKVTYFDDYGIVISRGQQANPFSTAIKAGHNAENHNHSDVGSYIVVLGDDIITGDIGAPSYTAGAFSKDNPARSSWGHPVPRIENKLQSNGREFRGEVLETEFLETSDRVLINLKLAYEIPSLEKLNRTMFNDKTDEGTITITDEFSATEPIQFGTAVMVNIAYEIVDDNTIIITSENQKVKVEISSEGGAVKIKDEVVLVEHLREGGPAYRIGIDFTEPIQKGSISVKYKPINN